jgi:hypothetical protein
MVEEGKDIFEQKVAKGAKMMMGRENGRLALQLISFSGLVRMFREARM